MKKIIKKLIPARLLNFYHLALALLAKWVYFNPSRKLIVIGVTGTNGKSTVVNLIGHILEEAGHKVGWTSTLNFKIADKEWLNDKKMTMVGRFQLQKLLRQMVKAKCEYAIIETSSEGIKQYRHLGINYDTVVFTNLTPEHIEAHGNFENYKKTKGKLFEHLTNSVHKNINHQQIPKTIIVNLDDQHTRYFLNFRADKKRGFTKQTQNQKTNFDFPQKIVAAQNISINQDGSKFTIKHTEFKINLLGAFNIENCLAAITTARTLSIKLNISQSALAKIKNIPGRMEFIDTNQNFQVLIDYAPEIESMKNLYEFINNNLKIKGKIIHLLGSCGGGRDKSRRPILGQIAATNADIIVITNEDPYDENPETIIDAVANGANKIIEQNRPAKKLYKITSRRKAIHKALSLAEPDDLVLLTGKGAEQFICIANGKKIPWDERNIVKQELKKLQKNN